MPEPVFHSACAERAERSHEHGTVRSEGAVLRRPDRALLLLLVAVFATASSSCVAIEPSDGYSRPIVITSGGTYSGRWESLDSHVPAVSIRTSEPVLIEDSVVRGRGDLIRTEFGQYANVTVRNVVGEGLAPRRAGQTPGRFLSADTYAFVAVENSFLVGTSGIYLHRSAEGRSHCQCPDR